MKLILGNSLQKLKDLPSNTVDACVCDPPYGLSFMQKQWDYDVPSIDLWAEVFRVLKPGAHLLSFFGTRTYHAGVIRIEAAGFEIRDMLSWLYGSGFPKSLDVSKAIDKAAGTEREVIGQTKTHDIRNASLIGDKGSIIVDVTAPATDDAKRWQGWGTALKPANEPIVLARKPLEKGLTVAENVLKWGTGALAIDACRIAGKLDGDPNRFAKTDGGWGVAEFHNAPVVRTEGRWPANVLLDEDAARALDQQSGVSAKKPARIGKKGRNGGALGAFAGSTATGLWPEDPGGGASRFFYVAKASKRERNAGLEGMAAKLTGNMNEINLPMTGVHGQTGKPNKPMQPQQNFHPTVKPIKLMEYLIQLVCPPGAIVLDPFMGSGSTGVAALGLGFDFIGIEREKEYFEIARRRLAACKAGK